MDIVSFLQTLAQSSHDLILENPYLWIFLLMTVESSFIPFPSEVVMIPAGYFAATGKINFVLGLLAGLLGSLFGAVINYCIGFYGGKAITKKILGEKNYQICTHFFEKHGDTTTLIGRFIPGIRQVISLPAGVFRMNIPVFLIYTAIGAGIWCLILMTFGYLVGENQAVFMEYKYHFTIGAILFAIFIVWIKIQILRFLAKKSKEGQYSE